MSLNDLYQSSKKDKKEATDKVMFKAHADQIKNDCEALSLRIQNLTRDVSKLEESVKMLEGLKMGEFQEKHARMKENYNNLVSNYNTSQADLKSVVLDLSKRLNDVESKF